MIIIIFSRFNTTVRYAAVFRSGASYQSAALGSDPREDEEETGGHRGLTHPTFSLVIRHRGGRRTLCDLGARSWSVMGRRHGTARRGRQSAGLSQSTSTRRDVDDAAAARRRRVPTTDMPEYQLVLCSSQSLLASLLAELVPITSIVSLQLDGDGDCEKKLEDDDEDELDADSLDVGEMPRGRSGTMNFFDVSASRRPLNDICSFWSASSSFCFGSTASSRYLICRTAAVSNPWVVCRPDGPTGTASFSLFRHNFMNALRFFSISLCSDLL